MMHIAALLDKLTGAAYIHMAGCCFFLGNEGLSIIENLGLIGIPPGLGGFRICGRPDMGACQLRCCIPMSVMLLLKKNHHVEDDSKEDIL